MADDLMLDPSLFLSREAFPIVLEALRNGELTTARIPYTFGAILREGRLSEPVSRFFGDSAEPLTASQIMAGVRQATLPQSYSPERFKLEKTEFDNQLSEAAGDRIVRQILIEEWEFLISSSWIAATVRKTFDAFLKGGAAAIEWGTNKFDYLAARTLKLKPDQIPDGLKPKQRLHAASKWVAVGGSSASAFLVPPAAAAALATTGYFLLFDP
jgi:hypothetical protein